MFPFDRNRKKLQEMLDQRADGMAQDLASSACNNGKTDALLRIARLFRRCLNSHSEPDNAFRAALLARLKAARVSSSASMPTKFSFSSLFSAIRLHRRASVAISLVLILALVGTLFSLWLPGSLPVIPAAYAQDNFTLKAEKSDSLGIESDSSFFLESKTKVNKDFVQKHLAIDPKIETNIEKISDQKFRISSKAPLSNNTVYRFSLKSTEEEKTSGGITLNYEWVYQVKNIFRTIGTLPANKSAQVPLSTGIEVYFSTDAWEIPEFQSAFSIDPKVEGRFEKHKRAAVFVPKELRQGTLYTVKIASSMKTSGSEEYLAEDTIFQFETESLESGYNASGPYFNFYEDEMSAGTTEPSIVTFTSANVKDEDLNMVIFQFASADDYLNALKQKDKFPTWAIESREQELISLEKLTKRYDFRPKVQRFQDIAFFSLPNSLAAGFYLLQTQVGSQIHQALIQASDIAAFISVSETKTLVWVNDMKTSRGVEKASVKLLASNESASTDADGVAFFPTPKALMYVKSDMRQYMEVTFGASRIFLSMGSQPNFWWFDSNNLRDQDDFWRYLYLDRPLYQPTDKIEFWGMLKARENGQPVQNAVIELRRPDYISFETGNVRPLATQELKPSDFGTFIGSFALENYVPGWYEVSLKVGNTTLLSRGIEIATYVKPLYQMKISLSKDAVFSGETVTAYVKSAFYDGTPMPKLPFEYFANAYGNVFASGNGVTDDSGEAELSIPTEGAAFAYEKLLWGDFRMAEIRVLPSLPEVGEISGVASWKIFPTSYALGLKQDVTDTEVVIRAEVKGIDLDPLNSPKIAYDQAGGSNEALYISGPVAGAEITGQVIKQSWKKVESGENYDFVNKQVIKEYYWEPMDIPLGAFSGITNPDGSFEHRFAYEPEASYRVEVSVKDPQARQNTKEIYVYGGRWKYDDNATGFFHQEITDETGDFRFDLGERVRVSLRKGDILLKQQTNPQYLYFRAKQGIRDFLVSASPVYEFPFDNSFIPNGYVGAVFFNGKYYEVSSPYDDVYGGIGSFAYNEKQSALSLAVRPSKEKYLPSEEASVEVYVTNRFGEPVSAEVNLSLVDEALFSLRDFEDMTDPLQTLYNAVSAGILQSTSSHEVPSFMRGGAEKGGGGGARGNFRDTAYFGVVRTGSDGRAVATFKLPDNITNFRVTAQAISGDLQAGRAQGRVVISKPIFVSATLARDYLASDKPIIKVRAFGDALKENEIITYEVNIPTLSFIFSQIGPAFSGVDVPLPALFSGKHVITYSAAKGGLSDTVQEPFMVLSSRISQPRQTWQSLSESAQISDVSDGLVDLAFVHEGRGKYSTALQDLRNSYGQRADQAIARKQAAELLKQYFQEEASDEETNLAVYQQNFDRGIQLLPYSNSDLDLSALVSLTAKEYFDESGLARYFYGILDDRSISSRTGDPAIEKPYLNTEMVSRALAGLAALQEPVINDLVRFYEKADLSTMDQLFLIAGMAQAGGKEQAKKWYFELTSSAYEEKGESVRLSLGVDQDDVLQATAFAAVLGRKFGDPRAAKLWNYAEENWTQDVLLSLQKIEYLKTALSQANAASEVSVEISSPWRKDVILLSPGETKQLTLTAQEAKSLKFGNIKGAIGLITTSLEAVGETELPRDADLRVSRKYTKDGVSSMAFLSEDIVRVEINLDFAPKAADGQYEIIDILPSGLRMIGHPELFRPVSFAGGEWNRMVYPLLQDGQRLHFFAGDYEGGRSVHYFARVINRGEFTAEPSLLFLERDPKVGAVSAAQSIKIR